MDKESFHYFLVNIGRFVTDIEDLAGRRKAGMVDDVEFIEAAGFYAQQLLIQYNCYRRAKYSEENDCFDINELAKEFFLPLKNKLNSK